MISKLHPLTEHDSRLAHYFVLFWDSGLRLGYVATSGANSCVIFLLGNPDFISYKYDEISCLSRLVRQWFRSTRNVGPCDFLLVFYSDLGVFELWNRYA